jgi:thiamine-monophosphate kinase
VHLSVIRLDSFDISDGLEQDLSHILTCSKVGAGINLEALPLSSEVAQHIANTQDWCVALAGGDDYELCERNKA